MSVEQIVNSYYDAWKRGGDFSGVPLADDFDFRGPVASFTTADGFREMARQAGQMVTEFNVRTQFVRDNVVCSIIDMNTSILPDTMTSAELLTVSDGKIVSGELIYDAQELRAAMAKAT